MTEIVNLQYKKIHNTVVNKYCIFRDQKPKFIFFIWYSTDSFIEINQIKPSKLPTISPKYKNLFCQTSKNVGSITVSACINRPATVSSDARLLQTVFGVCPEEKLYFLLQMRTPKYPVKILPYDLSLTDMLSYKPGLALRTLQLLSVNSIRNESFLPRRLLSL